MCNFLLTMRTMCGIMYIDILVELFLILEHDELLPDNIDGYNVETLITKY